jgi:XapX domain-containing protein
MRIYVLSLGAGVLVGILYSLLNVRSPAPPVVALVGLLGILVGEQIIPMTKAMVKGSHVAAAWRESDAIPHVFGSLPGRHAEAMQARTDSESEHADIQPPNQSREKP